MRRMVSEASAWCQVGRRCCHFPICELSSSFRHRRARARQDERLSPSPFATTTRHAATNRLDMQMACASQVKHPVFIMPDAPSTARRPLPARLRLRLRQPV
jgi:hypothetical protein